MMMRQMPTKASNALSLCNAEIEKKAIAYIPYTDSCNHRNIHILRWDRI